MFALFLQVFLCVFSQKCAAITLSEFQPDLLTQHFVVENLLNRVQCQSGNDRTRFIRSNNIQKWQEKCLGIQLVQIYTKNHNKENQLPKTKHIFQVAPSAEFK